MKYLLSLGMLLVFSLAGFAQSEDHQFVKLKAVKATEADLIREVESSPNEFLTNYNMAVYYYNIAIDQLDRMGASATDESAPTEDQVMELFARALPYAMHANVAKPSDANSMLMLSGIYFALNDLEKSNDFMQQYRAAAGK